MFIVVTLFWHMCFFILILMLIQRSDTKSLVYEIQIQMIREFGGVDTLFKLLKEQIAEDEVRFGSLRLINEISQQSWGVSYVYNVAGLVEYFLDRNFNATNSDILLIHEWKYAIVQSLFENENSKQVFKETHWKQLKQYLDMGVVFNTNATKLSGGNQPREHAVKIGWSES